MDKVVEYRKKYNYITNRAHTYQTNINPPKDILTEYVKLYTSGVLWLASGYALTKDLNLKWTGSIIVHAEKMA